MASVEVDQDVNIAVLVEVVAQDGAEWCEGLDLVFLAEASDGVEVDESHAPSSPDEWLAWTAREWWKCRGYLTWQGGPGEKAPAGRPPGVAPLRDEEAGEPPPAPHAPHESSSTKAAPPLAPESLAAMKGSEAELEKLLLRELDRRPTHAGQQISLWRALMRRSVEQIEERPAWQLKLAIGLAVALAALVVGSLLISGPKLWHILAVVGLGILLVRHGRGVARRK